MCRINRNSHFLILSVLIFIFVCVVEGKTGKNDTSIATSADINCTDPNGNAGKCIGVHFCEHIVNIIKQKTIPPNLIEFIRKSRCQGSEVYSVCCSPVESPSTLTQADKKPYVVKCGIQVSDESKLLGGSVKNIDDYPWTALIEYKPTENTTRTLCGGALISNQYVLTAGHCVTGVVLTIGTPVNIKLGDYDSKNDGHDCVEISEGGIDCTEGAVIIPIEKTIPHPDYDPSSTLRRHDIALVKMKELAPYTDFVRPICLPDEDIITNFKGSESDGIRFTVSGWGSGKAFSNKIKSYEDVPYRTLEVCKIFFNTQKRKVDLWKGQICAGGEPNKTNCDGDSGGPLMYRNGLRYELAGVGSFGPLPCLTVNVPNVFTKVFEYISWITNEIRN